MKRLLALLGVLVLVGVATMAAHTGRDCRTDRSLNRVRGCGPTTEALPSYTYNYSPDAGVCACAATTWNDGTAVTVVRSSAAWCRNDDGTYTSCAANLPRIEGGSTLVAGNGIRIERASTNYILNNRDLSDAAWTPTNMTCVRDATGVDGQANSASTCTATADSATVGQAGCGATYGSASAFVKRVTGTGTVEISCNGSSWSDITASVAGTWKRFSAGQQDAIYTDNVRVAALTNANCLNGVGGGVFFRLGTNTDAIAIDFPQCENLPYPTSPIETGGTATVRTVESASSSFTVPIGTFKLASSAYSSAPYSASSFNNSRGGTVRFTPGHYIWQYHNGTSPICFLSSAIGVYSTTNASSAYTGAAKKVRCYFTGGSGLLFNVNDGVSASSAASKSLNTGATLSYDFGSFFTGDQVDGVVEQVCISETGAGCP